MLDGFDIVETMRAGTVENADEAEIQDLIHNGDKAAKDLAVNQQRKKADTLRKREERLRKKAEKRAHQLDGEGFNALIGEANEVAIAVEAARCAVAQLTGIPRGRPHLPKYLTAVEHAMIEEMNVAIQAAMDNGEPHVEMALRAKATKFLIAKLC